MSKTSGNPHLQQAKIGRRKLRTGSLLVLFTMVFIALFSLYFVTTANVETKEFSIPPLLFFIIMLCTIPLLGVGVHYMIRGYRMETQGYIDDLKESEKQLEEITSRSNEMKL